MAIGLVASLTPTELPGDTRQLPIMGLKNDSPWFNNLREVPFPVIALLMVEVAIANKRQQGQSSRVFPFQVIVNEDPIALLDRKIARVFSPGIGMGHQNLSSQLPVFTTPNPGR